MKTKEEITDFVGARTYSPDEEVARKAPAVVCAVASRTFRLREKIKSEEFTKKDSFSRREVEMLVADYISILPFEKEILSGKCEQIDAVLRGYDIDLPDVF